MQVEPKKTGREVLDWCPQPRGRQVPGNHATVPPLSEENADVAASAENRQLNKLIHAAFEIIKKSDDPTDRVKGPRFVIQWRMFANASNPNNGNPDHCGCGCSCGCA